MAKTFALGRYLEQRYHLLLLVARGNTICKAFNCEPLVWPVILGCLNNQFHTLQNFYKPNKGPIVRTQETGNPKP